MEEKGTNDQNWRLFIGNLDRRLNDMEVLTLVSKYGKLKGISERTHKKGKLKGVRRGFCFVDYEKEEDAERARINLNGKIVGNRLLNVRWASLSLSEEYAMITASGKRKSEYNNCNLSTSAAKKLSSTRAMREVIEKKLRTMEEKSTPAIKNGK